MDTEKIKKAVVMLLEGIGEDPDREGLLETPDRIAKMYEEICGGMTVDAKEHLSKVFTVDSDEMVVERDIHFYSMCEHHMLPFFGKVHIAYIPKGEVVGLSKLARTVEVYARRLQLQERMTAQLAAAIAEGLGADGVLVVVEAEQLCMTMREGMARGTQTVTSECLGAFREDAALCEQAWMVLGGKKDDSNTEIRIS